MKAISHKMKYLVLALFLIPVICACPKALCDSLEDYVSANLKSVDTYPKDINEYVSKTRNKAVISDSDRIRYSNAYAYYAWEYYRKNDSVNALKSASLAVSLSPKNPVALFVGGYICKLKGDYANAVTCFQTASNMSEEKIKENAYKELASIFDQLMNEAHSLTEKKRFYEAGERLKFVAERAKGTYGGKLAKKKLAEIEDEITAAQMLVNIQKVIAFRSRQDAQRMLKEITTKYSWTAAGEEAQKMLRNTEDPFVKVKGDSLHAKAAGMQKWKMLETTNFIIYYRNNDYAKEVAKVIEKVYTRVVAELNLKEKTWKNLKCKIFLFDDDKTWSEFKKTSGYVSEWAAAFASPDSREIYGNAADGITLLNRNLPHEITHLIYGEYLGKNAFAPIWLTEGIAEHEQFNDRTPDYQMLKEYIDAGKAITLKQLTGIAAYPEKDIHYFYAASMAFVEFILEEYEYDSFHRLNVPLREVQTPVVDFEKICRRYLKDKPEEVEKKWIEFVKWKATGS
jgi:hypothetical protein